MTAGGLDNAGVSAGLKKLPFPGNRRRLALEYVPSLLRRTLFYGSVPRPRLCGYPMKVVYIAGPYRGSGEYQVLQNIREAEELALRVWRTGAACICPQKNTAFFGGAAPDEVWLKGDQEIVRRCDAVVCTKGWTASIGATGEVELARRLGIPVFEEFEEFERWLRAESHAAGDGSNASLLKRRPTT
jgi:hypothetical protein